MSSELFRRQVSRAVAGIIGPAPEGATESEGGFGLLDGPSVMHWLHADASMFVGGVRALLLQTIHPDAMYAVAEHSDYEHDPLGRLQRTAAFLGATSYGRREDAEQAVAIVRSIHETVIGQLPDGRMYRADDPHLLGWVHATEVESFLVANRRYGKRPATDHEADQYVADMAVVAEALGVESPPLSVAELAASLDSYRDELEPSPQCREATRFLFAPPLPITVLPFYGLIFSSAVALLPAWARSMLLLPVAPGIDPFVLRPAMTALTNTLNWALETDQSGGAST